MSNNQISDTQDMDISAAKNESGWDPVMARLLAISQKWGTSQGLYGGDDEFLNIARSEMERAIIEFKIDALKNSNEKDVEALIERQLVVRRKIELLEDTKNADRPSFYRMFALTPAMYLWIIFLAMCGVIISVKFAQLITDWIFWIGMAILVGIAVCFVVHFMRPTGQWLQAARKRQKDNSEYEKALKEEREIAEKIEQQKISARNQEKINTLMRERKEPLIVYLLSHYQHYKQRANVAGEILRNSGVDPHGFKLR